MPDSNSLPPVTPEEINDLEAASKEAAPSLVLSPVVRKYAAAQLATASALLEDCTQESEAFNIKESAQCIRAALRALASWKGGRSC